MNTPDSIRLVESIDFPAPTLGTPTFPNLGSVSYISGNMTPSGATTCKTASTTPPFLPTCIVPLSTPVRVGRYWEIDRITVLFPIFLLINTVANTTTFTFTPYLNSVPLSEPSTFSVNLPTWGGDLSHIFDFSLTAAQFPISITPYNSVQIRSGDELKMSVTTTTGPDSVFVYKALFQIVGTNNKL